MTVSIGDITPHIDRSRLVDRLQALVSTPSENPPGNEAEVAELVRKYCDELELKTSLHEGAPGRPSVVARWEGGPGPTVGYCSHIDVVPAGDPKLWGRDPFAAEIEGSTMYGRGSCDAKGPVAAALEAVDALRRSGWEPARNIGVGARGRRRGDGIQGSRLPG